VRVQPSQRFKVIGESLNDFSRIVGPFGFESPLTLAAPHHAQKGSAALMPQSHTHDRPAAGTAFNSRGTVMQRTISKTSLADECRKRAAECSETALQQQDPEYKQEYSYLATMWRLIALNSEEAEFV